MEYFHLTPDCELPEISNLAPFRAVVIVEEPVSPERRAEISKWLVEGGCLYMMAWGDECSIWDDSVDEANLEAFNFGEIPDEFDVMTTWHDNETLAEVFWFCKHTARHPTVDTERDVILHFGPLERAEEIKLEYTKA